MSKDIISKIDSLSKGIYQFDFLNETEIENIFEFLNNNEISWHGARVVDSDSIEYKEVSKPNFRSADVSYHNINSFPYELVKEKMENIVFPFINSKYKKKFSDFSIVQIVKYNQSDFFKPHTDTGSQMHSRYFTLVCYLNDDYVGGETYFPNINLDVKSIKGKCILFHSDFLHGAKEIIKGNKKVLVTWIKNSPPIKWI